LANSTLQGARAGTREIKRLETPTNHPAQRGRDIGGFILRSRLLVSKKDITQHNAA
jgi:hypothetical protein